MTVTTEVLTPEVIIAESNSPLITTNDAEQLIATIQPVAERVQKFVKWANDLTVTTEEDAVDANAVNKGIAADIKTVKDALSDGKKAAQDRHKLFTTFENSLCNPLDDAYRNAKKKLQSYDIAQAQKAEAERKRLQAIEDERVRKEQDRLAKEAARLKTPEKKEERLQQAAAIAPTQIRVEAPKSGVRITKYWKVEVVDSTAFFKAIIDRPDLAGYVTIDTTKLQRAKSANPLISIPGVSFTQEVR